MPSSREEQQRTRRRVDSSVSAACTSSPQPRCSPAFTCLPFARFPYPNVGERALDPHCGDHLNINRFPTAFPTAPTRRRLDRHAAWNSIATSQGGLFLVQRIWRFFPSRYSQTIVRCTRSRFSIIYSKHLGIVAPNRMSFFRNETRGHRQSKVV